VPMIVIVIVIVNLNAFVAELVTASMCGTAA
jgi:hypothetical protein